MTRLSGFVGIQFGSIAASFVLKFGRTSQRKICVLPSFFLVAGKRLTIHSEAATKLLTLAIQNLSTRINSRVCQFSHCQFRVTFRSIYRGIGQFCHYHQGRSTKLDCQVHPSTSTGSCAGFARSIRSTAVSC